ncbi:MAG: DUF1353 domain-containing protein [Flavobacteriia bacterium]|nr:DUF1353 domain-containing protein [Flavobacteriia bacterium]
MNCRQIPLVQPSITPISEREYELDAYHVSTFDYTGDGQFAKLIIQPKFVYDGASVPRLLWSLSGIRPDGLNRAASLVHDYIYVNKGELHYSEIELCYHGQWCRGKNIKISRLQCDRIFYHQLREAGVSKTKARMAYIAVRGFGWIPWMKKKK